MLLEGAIDAQGRRDELKAKRNAGCGMYSADGTELRERRSLLPALSKILSRVSAMLSLGFFLQRLLPPAVLLYSCSTTFNREVLT